MKTKYYKLYLEEKCKYINLKKNVLTDLYGLNDFKVNKQYGGNNGNKKNNILTRDSQILLNQLKPIINIFKTKFKSSFDSVMSKIKKNKKLHNLTKQAVQIVIDNRDCKMNYKIEYIKTSLGKTIKNIDMDDYVKLEKSGPREISEYFGKLSKKNNDKFINFGFLASDIIKEEKAFHASDNMNKLDKLAKITVKELNNKSIYLSDHIVNNDINKVNINNLVCSVILTKNIVENVVNYYFPSIHVKTPDFFLLLSLAKKIFPNKTINEKNVYFTVTSVNSAEFSPFLNKINIFRKEELVKLLFHEIIHRSSFDAILFDYNDYYENKWALKKDFSPMLLSEMITETLAEYLNIILIDILMNHNTDHTNYVDGNDNNYINLMTNEIFFGLFQTAKILYLSGIGNIKELYTKPFNNKIRTNTSLFEYHILKTICLINIDHIMDLYQANKITKMLDFIYEYAKNDNYKEIIDNLVNYISKNHTNIELYNTGRMSIYELNIDYIKKN